MDGVASTVVNLITTYGFNVVGGLALLVLGWIGANWVASIVRGLLRRVPKVDETLAGFFASLARYGVLAFVGVAVLNQFGIQTASIIAVLGAAGLAIGLALQGTLTNLAAGVMLLLFRPYRVAEYVAVAGTEGTVRELGLFTTELATPDNVHIIVPNAKIWGDTIKNFSHYPYRAVNLPVTIGAGDDAESCFGELIAAMSADARVLKSPPPAVRVHDIGAAETQLIATAWCAPADHNALRDDLLAALRRVMAGGRYNRKPPQRIELTRAAAS
jgi:small conductance mechanosensitive channel